MSALRAIICVACIAITHIICASGRTKIEEWGRVVSGEYCDYESFEAHCSPGEVMTILSAQYGHMEVGKCITDDLGFLGCQTDVLEIVERKCNGRDRCSIVVSSDQDLRQTKPCRSGIVVYLKATYACIKASPQKNVCGGLEAQTKQQFISSVEVHNARCPTTYESLKIRAKPGQHINLTLIRMTSDPDSRQSEPHTYGVVFRSDSNEQKMIASDGSGRAVQPIGMFNSDTVSIALDEVYPRKKFLIAYQAVGCADFKLPAGTIMERSGNELTVTCVDTQQQWQLSCRGAHWLGVIGNCTKPAPVVKVRPKAQPVAVEEESLNLPKDVIYLIIGCATVFLSVLVVTIGYVCLKTARLQVQSSSEKPKVDEWQFKAVNATLLPKPERPNSDYLTPRYNPEGQNEQTPIYDTPLPDPPSINTQPRGSVKRTNEEYDATMSSTSTDYTRKYFVLDADYMNTKNLLN